MSDPQYLILHKVRGQPQFDIADKAMFGDEEGWSLCTCGHRAYPYQWWELNELDFSGVPITIIANALNAKQWTEDWPEHYRQHPEPTKKLDKGVMNTLLNSFCRLKTRRI